MVSGAICSSHSVIELMVTHCWLPAALGLQLLRLRTDLLRLQPVSKFFQLLKIFSQVCVLLSGKVHQLFTGHLEQWRQLLAGVQRVRLALTCPCVSDPTPFPYSSAFLIMALSMDLAPCTSKSTLHNLFSCLGCRKADPLGYSLWDWYSDQAIADTGFCTYF